MELEPGEIAEATERAYRLALFDTAEAFSLNQKPDPNMAARRIAIRVIADLVEFNPAAFDDEDGAHRLGQVYDYARRIAFAQIIGPCTRTASADQNPAPQ